MDPQIPDAPTIPLATPAPVVVPIVAKPVSPFAATAPAEENGQALSAADLTMLCCGIVLAGLGLIGLFVLFPCLVITGSVAAVVLLMLGAIGAGLIVGALRRQMAVAAMIGGSLFAILLAGAVFAGRFRDQSTSRSGTPSEEFFAAADAPPAAHEAAPSVPATENSPATAPSPSTPSPSTPPAGKPAALAKPSESEAKSVMASTPAAAPPPASKPSSAGPAAAPPAAASVAKAKPASASSPHPKKTLFDDGRAGGATISNAIKSVALIEHPLGSGSGFAVAQDLVTTNAHVVDGAFLDEIKVQFGTENGTPRKVRNMLYFDRTHDLALVEVDTGVAGLPVRDDYVLQAGDEAVLVGNPSVKGEMLLRNAVNYGKLVAVVRIEGQDYYQIDADVNPGWSGGPVLDGDGRLIAVVAKKANDFAVMEIRNAMEKMDERFRTRARRGVMHTTGLTYGIPAGTLGKILRDPSLHDAKRRIAMNDRYMARTLLQRQEFLASLAMIRVQINVPSSVREEAQAYQLKMLFSRRLPHPAPSKAEHIRLIPEAQAAAIRSALERRELRSQERQFRKRLDTRLESVSDSRYLSDEVRNGLKALAEKIAEVEKFAEDPATSYVVFSTKIKGFSRELRSALKQMEKELEDEDLDESDKD
jgi:S1-C subfamily serine protease